MLNCSLISDGGTALVVTTRERAQSLKQKPIYVLGMGNAYSYYFCWNLPDYTDYIRMLVQTSADSAFAQAGVSRDDIDLAFVGDPADIATLVGLEGMGFAKPGEGVDFVQDGRIRVGGDLPVNTHGGCLSYAHPGAPGQHLHLIEAVRQLRGGLGDRQVPDAKIAAVHGDAGVLTSHCTLILGQRPLARPTGGNTPCPWTSKSSPPARTGRCPRRTRSPNRSGRAPGGTSWCCKSATSAARSATTRGPAAPSACRGNTEWTKVSGRGTVYSYTIVHRPLARWFKDKVPLVCAVIELDEGVRMVSNVENVDPYAVTIGMPVRVIYDDVNDEITLPKFEPVPA